MIEKIEDRVNGTAWRNELQYATSAVHRLPRYIRGRPFDVGDENWSTVLTFGDLKLQLDKLAASREKLARLVGGRAILAQLNQDEKSEPVSVEGVIDHISVNDFTIGLETDSGLTVVRYGELLPLPDIEQSFTIRPTIEMLCDVEYFVYK